MAIQIQIRRDTASNWSSNNPTLAIGELGFVTDTSQLKIGNGSVAWNSLPYFLNSASATTVEIAQAVANLIDLSPSTLDTLNELAAAIGDDANFATNIVNSISSASAAAIAYADNLTTTDIAEGTNLYFTNQRGIDSGSATYILQTNQQGIINSASAAAVTSANSYTDTEVAEAIVTASAAAVSYADGLTTADVAENTNLYFTNERAVNAGSATYILQSSQQGIINSASAAAASYTDGAITNLIDSAPGALNTLNELAAALGDDENFATSIVNVISSASANAITSANSYTDTEVAEAIVTASAAAVAYADGLTTTDVAEGTNLYFTNERAVNAGSATYILQSNQQSIINSASAAAVTSANSYTDTEVAEAIVTASAAAVSYADGLTTTDVAEGTNLYFTSERAVNAGSATYILQSNQQSIINSASAAAVTAVLDGAPGALDTLNELAASLNDDSSFATTVTNSLSTKLDLSTASATYATITSLASASAAAVSYADGLTTADVAENTNLYFTNERAVNAGSATYLTQAAYASASPNFATDAELASAIVTASAAAVAYADGLTTTDVAEGTNLYYTNTRGLETASTAFVHANHIGMSASFTSNQIRFDITEIDGGGV
jgi:hypothetical protein